MRAGGAVPVTLQRRRPDRACDENPVSTPRPLMGSDWFETVAEAQRRAEKRLPRSVHLAVRAGSERGLTLADNVAAYGELGFAPHMAGLSAKRELATVVMGQQISMPVLISPTGVQAIHPDGELAVARAAAARGTAMGLSSFASKPLEEVVAANPQTFLQVYWSGTREKMVQRLERARAAGAVGLIVTLDWSFVHARDWGSPFIPERIDRKAVLRYAPEVLRRPRWLAQWAKTRTLPDLTVPNWAGAGEPAPTFFGAYGEWMMTPPPSWERPGLAAGGVGRAVHAEGRHAGRRRPPGGRHRRHRHLGVEPRRQQPRRHPGHDPGAAGHRRGGGRRDRGGDRRRHPPGRRRRQGGGPRRPGRDDRPGLPLGPGGQRAGRRGERPRHPPQRHRLGPPRPRPRLGQRADPQPTSSSRPAFTRRLGAEPE